MMKSSTPQKPSRGFTSPSPFSLLLNLAVCMHIQQLSDTQTVSVPSIQEPFGIFYTYSLSCGELDERIETTLMSVQ